MDRWNDAVQPVRLLESDDAKNSNIMVDKNVCIMSALEFLPKLGRAWNGGSPSHGFQY